VTGSAPDPSELLALSRSLLSRGDPSTAGLWPRAAALLARQALELALDRYWAARGVPLDACPTLPQLICLAGFADDAGLAGRVRHAWNALSDACHHHAYELAPTAEELKGLLEAVEGFVKMEMRP
jgi:hypothetical protein